MYERPASRPWLSICFDSADARVARLTTARVDQLTNVLLQLGLKLKAGFKRLRGRRDERRGVGLDVVRPALRRADFDVRVGRALTALRGRAIGAGGDL